MIIPDSTVGLFGIFESIMTEFYTFSILFLLLQLIIILPHQEFSFSFRFRCLSPKRSHIRLQLRKRKVVIYLIIQIVKKKTNQKWEAPWVFTNGSCHLFRYQTAILHSSKRIDFRAKALSLQDKFMSWLWAIQEMFMETPYSPVKMSSYSTDSLKTVLTFL